MSSVIFQKQPPTAPVAPVQPPQSSLRSKEPAYGPSEPAPLLAPPPLPLPTPGIQDVKKSSKRASRRKSQSRKTAKELTVSNSGQSNAYIPALSH